MSIPRLAASIFASLLVASLAALDPAPAKPGVSFSDQGDAVAARSPESPRRAWLADTGQHGPHRLEGSSGRPGIDVIVPSTGRVFPETGQ